MLNVNLHDIFYHFPIKLLKMAFWQMSNGVKSLDFGMLHHK